MIFGLVVDAIKTIQMDIQASGHPFLIGFNLKSYKVVGFFLSYKINIVVN